MDWFYASELTKQCSLESASVGQRYLLEGEEGHHLARVLRAQPGDEVELFDGQGWVARGRVDQVRRQVVELAVSNLRHVPETGFSLSVAVSFPKGDRLPFLIEKLTELGVSRVIPLITQRSVVEPGDAKLIKLEKTVVAACKQSRRPYLMSIAPATPLETLIKQTSHDPDSLCVACDPRGAITVGEALAQRGKRVISFTAAIGPEGGWTQQEVSSLEQAGWMLVTLPGNILRTETAAIAVTAIVPAFFEITALK